MVKVYFEHSPTGYTTTVAFFNEEDTYHSCLPALEKLAQENNFDLVTESVEESVDLNEVERMLYDKANPIIKSPRTCDATGEGMSEGYCFGDGEKYFKYEADATAYAKEIGYDSLQAAYDDDAYYYTAWEDGDADDEQ